MAKVIDLSPSRLSNRIREAAIRAGLGDGFNGYSPRAGKAVDLAPAGLNVAEIQRIGRWASPVIPSRYVRERDTEQNLKESLPGRVTMKYAPLGEYLAGLDRRGLHEVRMHFAEIEQIIGDDLPPGARKHPEGWSNHAGFARARAWLAVGWKSKAVDVEAEEITFYRAD